MATCDSVYMFSSATLATDKKKKKKKNYAQSVAWVTSRSHPGLEDLCVRWLHVCCLKSTSSTVVLRWPWVLDRTLKVRLTSCRETDSSNHMDKRSKEHYVHSSKSLTVVFENNKASIFFSFFFFLSLQRAGLSKEACLYAGAEWLNSSVSQSLAKSQLLTNSST